MELAKIEVPTQNQYVLALRSTRITDFNKSDLVKALIDIISIAYYESGQSLPGETENQKAKNLQQLASSMRDEIITYFKYLRLDEIKIAFKEGVRNSYGEYFGLNITTFHKWLKSYTASEARKKAFEKSNEESERSLKPIMTKDQAEYAFKQTIKKQFIEFKKSGTLHIEFPAFVFDYFEKNDILKLSKEQKESIWDDACKSICEAKRLQRLNPKDRYERDRLTEFIERFEKGILNKQDIAEIKQRAKYMAIKQFYQSIETLNL